MKIQISRIFAALFSLALLCAGAGASAQPMPFNEAGVTMGHWHLNSRDIEVNKKIFVAMGGVASKPGDFDIVMFPGLMIILHLRPGSPPANGPTEGSVINHVGFIVQNVQESMARWKAAGVPVVPGSNNRLDQAYVNMPDGLRIEVLEDKAQKNPIQHEHVHFFLPEAVIAQSQAWYAKHFGAKPGVRNDAPVADIPGVQLRFAKVDKPMVPTRGRILDHIGFDVKDLKAFLAKLEADGIKIERPYTFNEKTGEALAFISDPWGVSIELNQRRPQ